MAKNNQKKDTSKKDNLKENIKTSVENIETSVLNPPNILKEPNIPKYINCANLGLELSDNLEKSKLITITENENLNLNDNLTLNSLNDDRKNEIHFVENENNNSTISLENIKNINFNEISNSLESSNNVDNITFINDMTNLINNENDCQDTFSKDLNEDNVSIVGIYNENENNNYQEISLKNINNDYLQNNYNENNFKKEIENFKNELESSFNSKFNILFDEIIKIKIQLEDVKNKFSELDIKEISDEIRLVFAKIDDIYFRFNMNIDRFDLDIKDNNEMFNEIKKKLEEFEYKLNVSDKIANIKKTLSNVEVNLNNLKPDLFLEKRLPTNLYALSQTELIKIIKEKDLEKFFY